MATDVVKNIQANIVSSFENKGFVDAGRAAKKLKKETDKIFGKSALKNLDRTLQRLEKMYKRMSRTQQKANKYGGGGGGFSGDGRSVRETAAKKGRLLVEQVRGAGSLNPALKKSLNELEGIANIAAAGGLNAADALKDFNKKLSEMPEGVRKALGHIDTELDDFGESLSKKAKKIYYDTKKGHEEILEMWKGKAAEFEQDLKNKGWDDRTSRKAGREMATAEMGKETGLNLGPALGGAGPIDSLIKSTKIGSAVSEATKLKTLFIGLKGSLPGIVLTKLVMSILDSRKELAKMRADFSDLDARSGKIPKNIYDISSSLQKGISFTNDYLLSWRMSKEEVMELGSALVDVGFKYESVFSEGSKVFEKALVTAHGLGVSFKDAADTLGDFQMTLGQSLDEAVEGLTRMRIDASKTSLTTDIFRKDVIQLSKELYLYNLSLKDISESFADIMAKSKMPAKIAEEQAKNLIEGLAKMSPELKVYLLEKGGDKKAIQKALSAQYAQLLKTEATNSDRDRYILDQLKASTKDGKNFNMDILNTMPGIFEAMGSSLQLDSLINVLKNSGLSDMGVEFEKLIAVFGFGKEMAPMLHAMVRTEKRIEEVMAEMEKEGSDKAKLNAELELLRKNQEKTSDNMVKEQAKQFETQAKARAGQKKTLEDVMEKYVKGGFTLLWSHIETSMLPLLAKSPESLRNSQALSKSTELKDAYQEKVSKLKEDYDIQLSAMLAAQENINAAGTPEDKKNAAAVYLETVKKFSEIGSELNRTTATLDQLSKMHDSLVKTGKLGGKKDTFRTPQGKELSLANQDPLGYLENMARNMGNYTGLDPQTGAPVGPNTTGSGISNLGSSDALRKLYPEFLNLAGTAGGTKIAENAAQLVKIVVEGGTFSVSDEAEVDKFLKKIGKAGSAAAEKLKSTIREVLQEEKGGQ